MKIFFLCFVLRNNLSEIPLDLSMKRSKQIDSEQFFISHRVAVCEDMNGIISNYTKPTDPPLDWNNKDVKSELMNFYQTNKFSLPSIQTNNPV
ncbi:hypothetical protein COBT_002548, partial [Conglomerata obtusa]